MTRTRSSVGMVGSVAESAGADQAGVGKERLHAVGRKRRRPEMGEQLESGIGGLEGAEDVVRAVLGDVVVVEPRLPQLPEMGDEHGELPLIERKLVLPQV